tara:strand:+ start:2996 stop:3433 length:438 start_codon:yes stop_codon:yes gene_type:complete
VKGQYTTINSKQNLELFIQQLREKWESNKWLQVQITTEKQRSQLQNRSLHLWAAMYASELNDRGLDVRHVINSTMHKPDVPWNEKSFKALVIHPIAEAISGRKSTASLSTSECTELERVINKVFGEREGFYVPWPSLETKRAANG